MNKEFSLQEKISESSTTTVYRAYDSALERTVLVKVLHPQAAQDAAIRARFEREARSLAAIHSEYIVQVYELTTINETPAIVMEYVEGESLDNVLKREGKLSYERVRSIAIDVLKGLSVVHKHGIIHRDIKPGNIILSKNGTAKLTDFGLAAVASMPTVTVDGSMLGTPAYMSPEQARGELLDSTTDLFSLGLTLFEALTGKRLCEGSTYMECLKKVMNFRFDMVEPERDSFPQDFYLFLKKLLAPQQKSRFQSAEEALLAIGVVLPKSPQKKSFASVLVSAGIAALAIGVSIWFVLKSSTEHKMVFDSPVRPSVSDHDTVKPVEQRFVPESDKKSHSQKVMTPGFVQQKKDTFTPSVHLPEAPDSVLLSITCRPWGKVIIDDEYVGETPLPHPLSLRTGKHTVVVQHPHFVPMQKDIFLSAAKKQEAIVFDFMETGGYLMITVLPWGKIYIDDQYRETTPLSAPLLVSAGKRIVRCEHPAFRSVQREVLIRSHETTYVHINLKSDGQ